jgi:hypothetical protein
MGSQFVNYQVKSNSQTDVVNAVQNLSLGKLFKYRCYFTTKPW